MFKVDIPLADGHYMMLIGYFYLSRRIRTASFKHGRHMTRFASCALGTVCHKETSDPDYINNLSMILSSPRPLLVLST